MKAATIELLAEVHDYIDTLNKSEGEPLNSETVVNMSNSLTTFLEQATLKFIAGQKEHGGDIRNRDLDEEMRKEHIDLFWYAEAKGWGSQFPTANII